MIFWFTINLFEKTSGLWCTIAVENITYPIIIVFIYVLISSLIVLRTWCNTICPDKGLFELVCRNKEIQITEHCQTGGDGNG